MFGEDFHAANKVMCGIFPDVCSWSATFFMDKNPDNDDPDRLQVYMGHVPAGDSVKSLMH